MCGFAYHGFIRRPSFLIIMDDLSSTDTFKNRRSNLYQLLISSRHLGIWLLISLHSWTDLTKPMRENFQNICLFRKIAEDRLKDIFESYKLESKYYKLGNFMDTY